MMSKALDLLALLPRHPQEVFDRIAAVVEVRYDEKFGPAAVYDAVAWDHARRDLSAALRSSEAILQEPALDAIDQQVRRHLKEIQHQAPFRFIHSADVTLARCCYLACRALKPDLVVETGVAYGVTSAYILQALEQNGRGTLYSIDLPPLAREGDRFVGAAIPEALKSRWQLQRGASKRVLPILLAQLRGVDMFVHDSLHTYRNMRWEFDTVWPSLPPGGVVIADDVENNPAFEELRRHGPAYWSVIQESDKPARFGVAIK